MTMPTTTADVPTALFDFADALALFSSELLRYRIRNKVSLADADRQALEAQEGRIDAATAQVRADGIAALGFLVQEQVAEVAAATDDAQAFLRRIKRADKALSAVAAVLGLGQAVLARSPKQVVDAAKALKTAMA
jgi:folate-binding Fe-S cluster repair protein YgfZ